MTHPADSSHRETRADALIREKNRILYANLPVSILGNAALGLILARVQSAVLDPRKCLAWLALIGAIQLARAAIGISWRRAGAASATEPLRWMRRFRVGTIATGLAWGLGAALLFPHGDETHQVFLAFVLAGLSAGAISSLAIDRVCVFGFIVPALLPLIANFLLEGGTIPVAMGTMVALFLLFISSVAAIGRQALKENFELRIRSDEREQLLRRDIEERKRMEEKLKHSNLEFQQFAHIAAHDLQEPLRMISSYVALLSKRYRGKLDADADEFIHYAVDGAMRLQDMINGLLQLSRVQTRAQEMAPVPADGLLNRALHRLEIPIGESHAKITSDPLPSVVADSDQLGLVFQNLISNAIKFRKPGTAPLIHVSAEPRESEWVFSVEDNGIGIEPKYRETLFVMFQRLHSREEYPGTGIGLAVCKRIVERHGGRIWYESQPGKGSRFFFTVPMRETGETRLAA